MATSEEVDDLEDGELPSSDDEKEAGDISTNDEHLTDNKVDDCTKNNSPNANDNIEPCIEQNRKRPFESPTPPNTPLKSDHEEDQTAKKSKTEPDGEEGEIFSDDEEAAYYPQLVKKREQSYDKNDNSPSKGSSYSQDGRYDDRDGHTPQKGHRYHRGRWRDSDRRTGRGSSKSYNSDLIGQPIRHDRISDKKWEESSHRNNTYDTPTLTLEIIESRINRNLALLPTPKTSQCLSLDEMNYPAPPQWYLKAVSAFNRKRMRQREQENGEDQSVGYNYTDQQPAQPVSQPAQPVSQPVQPVHQPVQQPPFQPLHQPVQPVQPVDQTFQPAHVHGPVQPGHQPVHQPFQPVPHQPVLQPVPHQHVHQPIPHQPVPHQPVPHQSVPHQPVPHQPVPHQPVPHQPIPHQPVPRQPVSLQPVPHQPVPHQPISHQPIPHQPVPHQPVPPHYYQQQGLPPIHQAPSHIRHTLVPVQPIPGGQIVPIHLQPIHQMIPVKSNDIIQPLFAPSEIIPSNSPTSIATPTSTMVTPILTQATPTSAIATPTSLATPTSTESTPTQSIQETPEGQSTKEINSSKTIKNKPKQVSSSLTNEISSNNNNKRKLGLRKKVTRDSTRKKNKRKQDKLNNTLVVSINLSILNTRRVGGAKESDIDDYDDYLDQLNEEEESDEFDFRSAAMDFWTPSTKSSLTTTSDPFDDDFPLVESSDKVGGVKGGEDSLRALVSEQSIDDTLQVTERKEPLKNKKKGLANMRIPRKKKDNPPDPPLSTTAPATIHTTVEKKDQEEDTNKDSEQSTNTSGDQATKPCKYFLSGHCIHGDNCQYSHFVKREKKKEMCKFYLQDACDKGDDCLFYHGDFPCKYFHTRHMCYHGDKCKFSHAPLNDESYDILMNVLEPNVKEFVRYPPLVEATHPIEPDVTLLPEVSSQHVAPPIQLPAPPPSLIVPAPPIETTPIAEPRLPPPLKSNVDLSHDFDVTILFPDPHPQVLPHQLATQLRKVLLTTPTDKEEKPNEDLELEYWENEELNKIPPQKIPFLHQPEQTFDSDPRRQPPHVNQPPTQFDQPRPQFDQPPPQFDQPRTQFDQPPPQFDQPRPQFDQPRPQFDQPRPLIEMRPNFILPHPMGVRNPPPIIIRHPNPPPIRGEISYPLQTSPGNNWRPPPQPIQLATPIIRGPRHEIAPPYHYPNNTPPSVINQRPNTSNLLSDPRATTSNNTNDPRNYSARCSENESSMLNHQSHTQNSSRTSPHPPKATPTSWSSNDNNEDIKHERSLQVRQKYSQFKIKPKNNGPQLETTPPEQPSKKVTMNENNKKEHLPSLLRDPMSLGKLMAPNELFGGGETTPTIEAKNISIFGSRQQVPDSPSLSKEVFGEIKMADMFSEQDATNKESIEGVAKGSGHKQGEGSNIPSYLTHLGLELDEDEEERNKVQIDSAFSSLQARERRLSEISSMMSEDTTSNSQLEISANLATPTTNESSLNKMFSFGSSLF